MSELREDGNGETVGHLAKRVQQAGVLSDYGYVFTYLGSLTINEDGTWTNDH